MSPTGIEWVCNPDGTRGITVNSKTGCRNHTPEGLCLGGLFPCYAWKLAHGRLRIHYQANWSFPPDTDVHRAIGDTFYPRWWPERLEQIRGIKKPTGIFLDDMSDWMGDYWPEEWTKMELQVMKDCPQHRFYILTKQPQNLIKFSPLPENCWVGVTVTNQEQANESIPILMNIKAKVRYVSLEPLLKPVDLTKLHFGWQYPEGERVPWYISAFESKYIFGNEEEGDIEVNKINWLIIGACTGTLQEMITLGLNNGFPDKSVLRWGNKYTLQPRIEWVQEIVEAADKAGVKVFLKDNLKSLLPKEPPFYTKPCADVNGKDPCYEEPCLSGHDIDQCSKAPGFWRLRQELPE